MTKAVIAAVLLVAVVAAVLFVRARRNGEPDAEKKYRTEAVGRGNVTMTVTATGTVSAVTTVQVGSQVSGVIAQLYADFMSRVKKGQLLAELDPTPLQAQVEQRRADVLRNSVDARNAALTYNRQKRLFDAGLAPQADVDNARAALDSSRAQVDQSQAALRQSETNLRYTRILSPIDGIVVDRQYDVGQTVAASFQAPTLFTIAQDLTKMKVQADVDQSDIGRVKVGQVSRFTVDAYPEDEFRGRIAQVRLNATVNQNVVSYPVIIEVPNEDEKLRPNMTANVTVEVAQVRDVLRVPNAALRFKPETEEGSGATSTAGGGFEKAAAQTGERQGGIAGASRGMQGGRRTAAAGQTIYLLRGGKVVPVQVRTGISDGRFTQITGGEAREGDRVIVGLATSKASQSQGNSTGARAPRMGRF